MPQSNDDVSELTKNLNLLLATFKLRESYYALDAAYVYEVIRVGEITPVPHCSKEILGVINLRGRIVTLIDISLSLGYGAAQVGSQSRVFIVEDRSEYVGMLADQVSEVTEVSQEQMQAPPANIPLEQLKYCRGVFRIGNRVVSFLDTNALLHAGLQSAAAQG